MTDWLFESVTNWVTESVGEWLTEWLAEWLSQWVNGWMTDRVTEWVGEWMTEWLTFWLTGWISGCKPGQWGAKQKNNKKSSTSIIHQKPDFLNNQKSATKNQCVKKNMKKRTSASIIGLVCYLNTGMVCYFRFAWSGSFKSEEPLWVPQL